MGRPEYITRCLAIGERTSVLSEVRTCRCDTVIDHIEMEQPRDAERP